MGVTGQRLSMLNQRIRQYLLFVALLFSAPAYSQGANGLKHHPSPYLSMHAKDPIEWNQWGESVLQKAREQNRLILVSTGYFSCHWCHVMQRESYSDEEVADIVNQHYLAVIVDRELRPELDNRLIEFVQKIRGSSGWPLHVFLTPEGYPITGFTYLPKAEFTEVLLKMQSQWISRQDEIKQAAREFFEATIHEESDSDLQHLTEVPVKRLANAFISQSMRVADTLQGGFGDIAKFPQIPQFLALSQMIETRQDRYPEVVEFIKLSLKSMASFNLMDHINGGFFRYTTDPDWQTPHFEKMLYDNAQMVLFYLQAERLWPGEGYLDIARLTLQFIQADMQHASGGYTSSLSAVDVKDLEGGHYLWSREELVRLLDAGDFEYLSGIWRLDQNEQANNQFLAKPLLGIDVSGDPKQNSRIRRRLQLTEKPPMPVDNKRLASWNALILHALVAAAQVDNEYRAAATRQYQYMVRAFIDDGQLVRLAENVAKAETTFEDYAFTGHAFLRYGQGMQDSSAIEWARKLAIQAHRLYLIDNRWKLVRGALIPSEPGQWVVQDKAISSPMTQWIETVLGLPNVDPIIKSEAQEMLQRVTREMLDRPYYYGSLIALRERLESRQ